VVSPPKTVTHRNTNRARRRATSLVRPNDVTATPRRHLGRIPLVHFTGCLSGVYMSITCRRLTLLGHLEIDLQKRSGDVEEFLTFLPAVAVQTPTQQRSRSRLVFIPTSCCGEVSMLSLESCKFEPLVEWPSHGSQITQRLLQRAQPLGVGGPDSQNLDGTP